MRKRYTESERKLIETYTSNGVSDKEIKDLTGFNIGFVTITTTKYWQRKMRNKDE